MNDVLLNFPWFILFVPLVSALVITFFTKRNRGLSAGISIGAIVISFILSLILFVATGTDTVTSPKLSMDWLSVGNFIVDFGITIDPLSKLMLLIVTGVGSAIHIYSWGYMHEDRAVSRYFASLSLFTFSMLGIVLSNNFLQMFIFWELVGVSSYLLIGFWYERPPAADAAKKAFITNRLGDFGFLLGIIMVWSLLGSLNFTVLQEVIVNNPAALGGLATVVGLLLFCGAVGKSAQFPLHVWLPDAMEGPTPVSALIHAATMVAAGVYMLCRVYFLLNLSDSFALEVIGWVGGLTALLAALIAVQQNDIKRILAYSTLSQLGLMVMAVGAHQPVAGMFHLTTHAFFKALLFLGAGSVIHALHHEQDIWKMGGLKKKMPVTFWTFLIGTLALSGVPPFSGFYSKDFVLSAAYDANIGLFVIGVIVSVLTTFYMFRLFFVAFLGHPKSESAEHAHESPKVMTVPLQFLTVLSVVGGLIGVNHYVAKAKVFPGSEHHFPWYAEFIAPIVHAPVAALFGIFAVVVGFTVAYKFYAGAQRDPLPGKLGALSRAMRGRFYFDEIYSALIFMTHEAVAKLADAIDRWIIAGLLVRGTHGTTELFGRALRLVQTGNLQTYAFLIVAGVAVVLFYVLFR
ncbi:MAG: NADH-quinone oxidoreductase subunit L [Verrucomicrobia bacterium]|nr:NADH-quinone oxidoreductase subunit L [Verrucomicrobiota bacterium]